LLKSIEVNRSHNRPIPGTTAGILTFPPIVEADPEEEVALQTRHSMDGQFNAKTHQGTSSEKWKIENNLHLQRRR